MFSYDAMCTKTRHIFEDWVLGKKWPLGCMFCLFFYFL